MCLLAVTLMQIYSEKEQAEQGKTQNVHCEEKRGTRKCNGAKSCAQAGKKCKEKPDAKWYKDNDDLRVRFQLSKEN